MSQNHSTQRFGRPIAALIATLTLSACLTSAGFEAAFADDIKGASSIVGAGATDAVCSAAHAAGLRSLTLEDRVAAQRAIEQVFWRHRIWPQDNRQPKPSLAEIMPDEAIRAKIEDG